MGCYVAQAWSLKLICAAYALLTVRNRRKIQLPLGYNLALLKIQLSLICRKNIRSCLRYHKACLHLAAMITVYLSRKALIQSISDPIDTPAYKRMWWNIWLKKCWAQEPSNIAIALFLHQSS
jgi:hypothetical protein